MDAGAVFVADGAPGSGLGHISRSSAVAVALATRGVASRCYALGALGQFERDGVRWLPGFPGGESTELLVLDSYGLTHEDVAALPTFEHLVVLSEEGLTPTGVGLLVDVAADPSAAGDGCLYGFQYACLRPAFWGLPPRREHRRLEHVLVATGSGDVEGAGAGLAEAVRAAAPDARVTLVRGPYAQGRARVGVDVAEAPSSLLPLLRTADAIVTAGGQTMLEAAAMGVPLVAVPLVENQRSQAERLAARGGAMLVSPDEAAARVAELARDADLRAQLAARAQETVDGYGALRVAYRVAEVAGKLR